MERTVSTIREIFHEWRWESYQQELKQEVRLMDIYKQSSPSFADIIPAKRYWDWGGHICSTAAIKQVKRHSY